MRFPPVGRDQMGDGGAMRAIRAYWIDRFDPEENLQNGLFARPSMKGYCQTKPSGLPPRQFFFLRTGTEGIELFDLRQLPDQLPATE